MIALIKAHIENGSLVLDEPLPLLPERQNLLVRLELPTSGDLQRDAVAELDLQMPAFLRGDEDEDGGDLF